MRKLEINLKGTKEIIGIVAPNTLRASLCHVESKINFEVVLNVQEFGRVSVERLITRIEGQGDTFVNIRNYYYQQYKITEESPSDEIDGVMGIMEKDLYYDFEELINLIK